jgi:hypothetical protein
MFEFEKLIEGIYRVYSVIHGSYIGVVTGRPGEWHGETKKGRMLPGKYKTRKDAAQALCGAASLI